MKPSNVLGVVAACLFAAAPWFDSTISPAGALAIDGAIFLAVAIVFAMNNR